MLTPPQSFIDFQNVFGTTNMFVVKLTDGTSTWYFSNGELELTDGHVYRIITAENSISQSIDIFTKQWSGGTSELELVNVPYRQNSSGVWVRPSDELTNIVNNDADIYLVCGGNVQSLSDCLLYFKGTVAGEIIYNDKTLLLQLQDTSARQNRLLPQTKLSAMSFENPPPENLEEFIPLIYGEFKYDFNDRKNDLGLAKVFVADMVVRDPPLAGQVDAALPEVVIANHDCDTKTALYMKHPRFVEPLNFQNVAFAAPLGRTHGTIESDILIQHIYPVDDFGGDYTISGDQKSTDNHNLARDRNPDTFADILDFVDPGPSPPVDGKLEAIAFFCFSNYGTGDELNLPILPGSMAGRSDGDIQIQVRLETAADVIWGNDSGSVLPEIRWYHKKNGGDVFINMGSFTNAQLQTSGGTLKTININPFNEPEASPGSWGETISWHIRAGRSDITTFDDLPQLFVIYGVTDENQNMTFNGDGVPNNQTLLKCYDVRLRFALPLNHDEFIHELSFWFEGKGAEYESWITSRSSNYASGDAIEDPAGIIESLLRVEVGLGDSSFDLTSFIDAENTNVKARINFHSVNHLTVFGAIRQLAEQSTFAYAWLAQGKARLIELNNSSPTTNRTIPFSQIVENTLEITKQVFHIVNDLNYDSRFRQETNKYQDINTVVTNSSSDTDFGTRYYSAKWPNIVGSSATHVANHLVGNSTGIWANEHLVLDLETTGFSNADLEIGDWIELDDVTFDSQILLDGATWSDKQFLVIELQQYANRTRIKALQLY